MFCSVPICPLDPLKAERIYLAGEPKCSLSKNKRLKLGKDLPWKGLFPREFAGLKNWNKKTEFQKRELVQKLALSGGKNQFTTHKPIKKK